MSAGTGLDPGGGPVRTPSGEWRYESKWLLKVAGWGGPGNANAAHKKALARMTKKHGPLQYCPRRQPAGGCESNGQNYYVPLQVAVEVFRVRTPGGVLLPCSPHRW